MFDSPVQDCQFTPSPVPADAKAALEPSDHHAAESELFEDIDDERVALPLRSDTILGVCQAIGEDFGFHPNWLRILFASALLASPAIVIGTYLGLGVLVAASRLIFPRRVPAKTVTADTGLGVESELELQAAAA